MTVVREAGPDDVGGLAELRRRWTEENVGPVADPEFERDFAAWWDGAGRVAFVAEQGGRPVGMMNLAIFDRMPWPGRPRSRWAYLSNAFVLPGHRDLGIGGRLLAAVVGRARELGCVRVVLAPTERSRPFYRRAGFGDADLLLVHPLGD